MITVGCTIPAYKMTGDDWHSWGAWLANQEEVKASVDTEVEYFCAIEVDGRGLTPFVPLLEKLQGKYWSFRYDDHVDVITTATRLRRICAGHNMVSEYAIENGSSHCLFLASDTQAPDDVLPRLLEVDRACVAAHVPTYNLGRQLPRLDEFLPWDVRSHMETCCCMMLRRDVFRRVKWRTDADAGMTDDPCMHADLRDFMGERVYSRHDVTATHWPESIPRIEDRHTEAQRTLVR